MVAAGRRPRMPTTGEKTSSRALFCRSLPRILAKIGEEEDEFPNSDETGQGPKHA